MKRRTVPDLRGRIDVRVHHRAFMHAADIFQKRRSLLLGNRGRQFSVHLACEGLFKTEIITFRLHCGFRVFGGCGIHKAKFRDLERRLADYRRDLARHQATTDTPLSFRTFTRLTAALSYHA
jgi:hypothetical protein